MPEARLPLEGLLDRRTEPVRNIYVLLFAGLFRNGRAVLPPGHLTCGTRALTPLDPVERLARVEPHRPLRAPCAPAALVIEVEVLVVCCCVHRVHLRTLEGDRVPAPECALLQDSVRPPARRFVRLAYVCGRGCLSGLTGRNSPHVPSKVTERGTHPQPLCRHWLLRPRHGRVVVNVRTRMEAP